MSYICIWAPSAVMNGGICMHAHNNITICCRVGYVYPMVQCCIFRCWKRVQRIDVVTHWWYVANMSVKMSRTTHHLPFLEAMFVMSEKQLRHVGTWGGATRRQEGGMSRGNAMASCRDERSRRRSNERTRRGDATTSWRDKRTRGWHNKRMMRGNVTTSWCNHERATRGDAATSWHDEMTRGQRDKRQHNLLVFWFQTESTGKLAVMVVARLKQKPEWLGLGDEW